MGSELEHRLCQNLTNLTKFQLREKSSDLPSYWSWLLELWVFQGFLEIWVAHEFGSVKL